MTGDGEDKTEWRAGNRGGRQRKGKGKREKKEGLGREPLAQCQYASSGCTFTPISSFRERKLST